MPTARSLRLALGLTKKETTFGGGYTTDATALTDMIKAQDIDFAKVETTYRDDLDELNSYGGPTEFEVEKKAGTLSRKFRVRLEWFAAFLVWLLGRLTTSGSGPYTHTLKWTQICTLNPVSFAMIEGQDCAGATGTYFGYKGCVVDQASLERTGQGALVGTVTAKHDGSETAKASFVMPTAYTAGNALLGSMDTLKCGPLGTENLTSILRTWKITINAGIVEPDSSAAGIYVGEYQYGDGKPDLQITFSIKADKSHAVYGYYQNNTTVIFDLLTEKTAAALSQKLHCTACKIKAEEVRQGSETRLNVTVMPMWNATDDGPGVWTIINGIASYLNAA